MLLNQLQVAIIANTSGFLHQACFDPGTYEPDALPNEPQGLFRHNKHAVENIKNCIRVLDHCTSVLQHLRTAVEVRPNHLCGRLSIVPRRPPAVILAKAKSTSVCQKSNVSDFETLLRAKIAY